ncbi:MAG: hypothetical protein WC222_09370 [Parachlamydiales bacterium]|jgi:hypothetical protein
MKPSTEELLKAFKVIIDAQKKAHEMRSENIEDAFDSYVHSQILLLQKEFPDTLQALLKGYTLFTEVR